MLSMKSLFIVNQCFNQSFLCQVKWHTLCKYQHHDIDIYIYIDTCFWQVSFSVDVAIIQSVSDQRSFSRNIMSTSSSIFSVMCWHNSSEGNRLMLRWAVLIQNINMLHVVKHKPDPCNHKYVTVKTLESLCSLCNSSKDLCRRVKIQFVIKKWSVD